MKLPARALKIKLQSALVSVNTSAAQHLHNAHDNPGCLPATLLSSWGCVLRAYCTTCVCVYVCVQVSTLRALDLKEDADGQAHLQGQLRFLPGPVQDVIIFCR